MQHRLPLRRPPAAKPHPPSGRRETSPPNVAEPAPTAARIRRGVVRLLDNLSYRTLVEMRLSSGRRVDVIGLDARGRFAVVEIKTSLADLRGDQKWQEYLPYCDDFYFAVANDFPLDAVPDETGVIIADRFGGEVIRPSPRRAMATAARNRQTLLFAHTAGARLFRLQSTSLYNGW